MLTLCLCLEAFEACLQAVLLVYIFLQYYVVRLVYGRRASPVTCVEEAPCKILKVPPSCSFAGAATGSIKSAESAAVDSNFLKLLSRGDSPAMVTEVIGAALRAATCRRHTCDVLRHATPGLLGANAE